MKALNQIIEVLTLASVGFILVMAYLSLNKLWKRKHKKEVAESISVTAKVIEAFQVTVFGVSFALSHKWNEFVGNSIIATALLVQATIGIGLWVPEMKRRSVLSLIKRAFRQEGSEVGDLAKALVQPSSADLVVNILIDVALVDNELDPMERRFINGFIGEWDLDLDVEKELESWNKSDKHFNLNKARGHITSYLKTSPPVEQVHQLSELANKLVEMDGKVTEQETMLVDELNGMIADYLENKPGPREYRVALIPQDSAQEGSIQTLFPDLTKQQRMGGYIYETGPYYSKQFAQNMAETYHDLNLCAVVLD